MIKDNMFYGDPTLKDYREMDIREIIREHLLTKGTTQGSLIVQDGTIPCDINRSVSPKDLVRSGLFVYGLMDNPTNRSAIEYYCERWARQNQIMTEGGSIKVPNDLWRECDEKNREFTKGKDREDRPMKIRLTENAMCAHDLHELTNYPRPWFKEKPMLQKGTVLTVKETWSNFFGTYYRCDHENGTYDIKRSQAEIIEM